ncbi:Aste57867_3831 [Aphanomyces stellatus]|uniref:Aste57867_3831 protein n=1 Tax=Aphanomyces stellatus TaxID=120398 RepID=A0A485KFV4_9STRA|nr:hypothetical protein As57867_003820 [Aphanomyces stellatus]VFT80979.1 Aste57867_3831 [Aphanomyces stellatus]
MSYSRVLNYWHQHAGVNIWIELRLMAMNARWLWLNCFILKGLKWGVHFVSRTQYTGDNKVVGWCTFSSVSYVYLGMIFLFFRNDFIEHGNADNVMLTSTTQNIDAIGVELFSSWYVCAVPSFACAIFANLFVLLALDHILHWRWWAALAKNSLGRQLAFNSTSILDDVVGVWGDRLNYKGTVLTTKARALCTFRWFLATHLIRFGLAEHPSVVRNMVESRVKTAATNKVAVAPSTRKSTQDSSATASGQRVPRVESTTTKESSSLRRSYLTDTAMADPETRNGNADVPTSASVDLNIFLQDRQGHLHLVDGDKREMHGVNMEVKILHDSFVTLG